MRSVFIKSWPSLIPHICFRDLTLSFVMVATYHPLDFALVLFSSPPTLLLMFCMVIGILKVRLILSIFFSFWWECMLGPFFTPSQIWNFWKPHYHHQKYNLVWTVNMRHCTLKFSCSHIICSQIVTCFHWVPLPRICKVPIGIDWFCVLVVLFSISNSKLMGLKFSGFLP